MEHYQTFDAVFEDLSEPLYHSDTIRTITGNRKRLEGKLFFDRLLDAIGIQNAIEHYPPRNTASLQSLFDGIIDAQVTDTHKAALLYYLRLDFRLEPKSFAHSTYLPERYIILIDGLWHLDRLHLSKALQYLTEPTLIPTFSEEILYTFATQDAADLGFAMEYYNTTSPTVTSTKNLKAYLLVVARASITEGFFFTRKQADLLRKYLFEALVTFVHTKDPPGELRAKRAMEFVGLPLDAEEEAWLEEYLLSGDGKTLHGAKDTIIVRRIATGNSENLAKLTKESKDRKIDGINWRELTQGLINE